MRMLKVLLFVCILAGVLFSLARAAPDALAVDWSVLSSGGALLQSGSMQLVSSVGQPAAGQVVSGVMELCAGYLCAPWSPALTLPLVYR